MMRHVRRTCLVTLAFEDDRHHVGDAHVAALRAVGLEPLLIPADADRDWRDVQVREAAAVYLPGSDFVPEVLDQPEDEQERAAAGQPRDPRKVDNDLAVLHGALAHAVPLLAVCGGMQALAIALGGRLAPIAGHADGATHDVALEPGTLAERAHDGAATTPTASFHRQAVVDPGGLTVSARDAHGVIEAVELRSHPFVLGLQWHPEKRGDLRPFRALAQA